jgi:hypothetical protein
LITLKSVDEIAVMRTASRIVAEVLINWSRRRRPASRRSSSISWPNS